MGPGGRRAGSCSLATTPRGHDMSDVDLNTKIIEGEYYELSSSALGDSCTLRFKVDNAAVHLNGEDALKLRAEFEAIRLQFPTWKPDQTLAQLWDQGGYSWLASQDGGC